MIMTMFYHDHTIMTAMLLQPMYLKILGTKWESNITCGGILCTKNLQKLICISKTFTSHIYSDIIIEVKKKENITTLKVEKRQYFQSVP